MICKFCGNEIDDGSEFCFICGQKVEVAAPAYAVAGNDVYSQAATAEPVAPVEAAPVASAPVEAPAVPVEDGKKKKKEKNPANGFLRFICVILPVLGQLIGLCAYSKAKKKGDEAKAIAILNSTMRGLCLWMAVIIVVMFIKFVLS
ncbi:MAG: zinc-ribbon domain-containing protein [Faecalibacterium sp.]|nr:zinc-ribbon domain-containing protein [Ruminococcus sp.]MCM1392348.1 zinc-ribbon domain-containing protein [Ruminococcus sp.]MCM1484656.1 zinc-ribbon domain-containing protein [Faecalibacterium sp.]